MKWTFQTYDGENNQSFYFTTKISKNIEKLENGYLRCNNVIMGRTGPQQYTTRELGIKTSDGREHIVNVNRYEEDVFHPDTLKSIEGKPVTDGHPRDEDGNLVNVTADNVDKYRIGYILNVRRDGNNIVGDIIIEKKEVADAILNKGKKELSLGYTPVYELDGDDSLKQTKIVVNHLAWVEKGRAGNAMIVDEANQDLLKRGEYSLKRESIFTKFFRSIGIKKLTLDDGSELDVDVEDEIVGDGVEPVVEENSKDETTKEVENTVEPTVDETLNEDDLPKGEEPITVDDNTTVRKTVVEEHHESDYYEEHKKTEVVETTTTHHKTEEEIEEDKKKKEIDAMLTLDEALKKIAELEPLKGTEAYKKAVATIDSEMVEAGLGSILTTDSGEKIEIFGKIVPKNGQVGDETPQQFKAKDFLNGISAIYAQYSPKALDKVSRNTVDRAMRIRELGEIDPRDLIKRV